jgi:hypothetical protein
LVGTVGTVMGWLHAATVADGAVPIVNTASKRWHHNRRTTKAAASGTASRCWYERPPPDTLTLPAGPHTRGGTLGRPLSAAPLLAGSGDADTPRSDHGEHGLGEVPGPPSFRCLSARNRRIGADRKDDANTLPALTTNEGGLAHG